MDQKFCKKKMYRGAYHAGTCKNAVWRDGWCGVHHPERVAERRAASDEKDRERTRLRQEAEAARQEVVRRARAYPGMLTALQQLEVRGDVPNTVRYAIAEIICAAQGPQG